MRTYYPVQPAIAMVANANTPPQQPLPILSDLGEGGSICILFAPLMTEAQSRRGWYDWRR